MLLGSRLLLHKGIQTLTLTRNNIYTSLILHRWYQSTPLKHKIRPISTFDPEKLQCIPQNIYDISSVKSPSIRFRTISGTSRAEFRFLSTKDDNDTTKDLPFPPQSRGFFYYYTEPQLPLHGGIRFRLCDSIETFDKGEDLQTSISKPWHISILRIASSQGFKGLTRFLIEEGLVEMKLVQDLRRLRTTSRFVGQHLYHLSQPLVINLKSTALTVHLVTRKSYSNTVLCSPFYNSHKACKPYSGLAKARFELSTWPVHEKNGPTLVLRILEFLSPAQRLLPPDTGPYVEVVPNSLAMRRTTKGELKPWTYPIDKRTDGAKWKEFLAASSNY